MDIYQETVKEVRTTEARSRRPCRTPYFSPKYPFRCFGSLDQRARSRMVVVLKAVPPREHPAAFDHRRPVQVAL